jgi:N-acetylneuraminic acid mutarotase
MRMRRRSLVASGLGLMAAAATGADGVGLPKTAGGFAQRAQAAAARSDPPGPPQGRWLNLAPFPRATEELAGAAANGRLYASQGLLPGFKAAGLMYEYDPDTDAWTQKKPMPHAIHHSAVEVLNEKLYFFGGFEPPTSGPPGWVPVNDAWEYDPATDTWRALAPMPTKRGAALAAVAGGKFYVIGGAAPLPGARDPAIRPGGPQRSLATVEEYDPGANSWRPRAAMPVARNHLAGGAVRGKVYAIGGRLGGAFIIGMPGNVDLVEEYDPATDAWTTRAPMPTARSGLNSAVMGDVIYVAGGEVQTYEYLAAFRAFEAYDPAANTWWILPYMPLPRHECIMAAMGNRIHLAGGSVQSAIVPLPQGVNFDTVAHDAFELGSS